MRTQIILNAFKTKAEVEWSGSKYHHMTMYRANGDPGDPEEGGLESIDAVWVTLKDTTGDDVLVDVLPLYEEGFIIEQMKESMDRKERMYYNI